MNRDLLDHHRRIRSEGVFQHFEELFDNKRIIDSEVVLEIYNGAL